MTDRGCVDSFERYADELDRLLLQSAATTTTTVAERDGARYQYEELVRCMTLEARSVSDPELRRQLSDRVKAYRQADVDRRDPWGDGRPQTDDSIAAQTQTTETLDRALRSLHETESTAAGVVDALAEQRATLESTRTRIHETRSLATRAQHVLKRMTRWG